jgi:hypothetical protein
MRIKHGQFKMAMAVLVIQSEALSQNGDRHRPRSGSTRRFCRLGPEPVPILRKSPYPGLSCAGSVPVARVYSGGAKVREGKPFATRFFFAFLCVLAPLRGSFLTHAKTPRRKGRKEEDDDRYAALKTQGVSWGGLPASAVRSQISPNGSGWSTQTWRLLISSRMARKSPTNRARR